MIHYWDTSALLACLVEEKETQTARFWLASSEEDPKFTSWLTLFEMEMGLRRKLNQKLLTTKEYELAQDLWSDFQSDLNFLTLNVYVTRTGLRLQKLYNLKTGDSVQLGSASSLQLENSPVQFISLDQTLTRCAKQEGFQLPKA